MRIELRREQADYLKQLALDAAVAKLASDSAMKALIAGYADGAKIAYDFGDNPFIEVTEQPAESDA